MEKQVSEKTTSEGFFGKAALASIPVVLTIAGGFAANYFQSERLAKREAIERAELAGIQNKQNARQFEREKLQRAEQFREAERGRKAEADRLFALQEREIKANALSDDRRHAREQETQRLRDAAEQSRQSQAFDRQLRAQAAEREGQLIQKFAEVPDVVAVRRNLEFLIDIGMLPSHGERIRDWLKTNPGQAPVTGSLVGVAERAQEIRERNQRTSPGTAMPACQRQAGERYCIANDILIGPNDAPVPTVNAAFPIAPLKSLSLIVMHFTAGPDGTMARLHATRSSFASGAGHVEINRDGSITQLVPFKGATRHVGVSRWKDLSNLNAHSIGIELANQGRLSREGNRWVYGSGRPVPDEMVLEVRNPNTGETEGWERFTDAQLDTATALVMALKRHYPTITDVVGHQNVSIPVGRRNDPGPAFPMEKFKALVKGAEIRQK